MRPVHCSRLPGASLAGGLASAIFGVCAGTLACVPAYNLLVPNAEVLGTKFAAPAALIWKSTAEVLAFGLQAIPPSALYLAGYFGLY